MTDETWETRIAAVPLEVTGSGSATSGLEIGGLAVPYNTVAEINDQDGHYLEAFAPGAFSGQRKAPQLYFHHGQDVRTGRVPIGIWSQYWEAEDGLRVRGRLFNNELTRPLADAIQAGALCGLSVNFRSPADGQTWSRNNDGMRTRLVSRATTREISLTDSPAYELAGLGRSQDERERLLEIRAKAIEMIEGQHRMTPQQRHNYMRLHRII
jgi:HK97 family phage prohead protease